MVSGYLTWKVKILLKYALGKFGEKTRRFEGSLFFESKATEEEGALSELFQRIFQQNFDLQQANRL